MDREQLVAKLKDLKRRYLWDMFFQYWGGTWVAYQVVCYLYDPEYKLTLYIGFFIALNVWAVWFLNKRAKQVKAEAFALIEEAKKKGVTQ